MFPMTFPRRIPPFFAIRSHTAMPPLRSFLLTALAAMLALFAAAPRAQAAPGDLVPLNVTLVGSGVNCTAVQPDGKTVIAGSF